MPTEFGDPTVEELSQQTTEFGDVIIQDVPRGTTKAADPRVSPAPTIGERAKAMGIGALETIGRWPGELATAAGQISANTILPPFARQALNLVVPGSEKVLNQAIDQSIAGYTSPIQNLTPKAFNTLSEAIGSDVRYDDPNNPQFKAPYFAAAGEFIPNAASLFIRGPTGVRPAQTIAEVGKEASSMVGAGVREALGTTGSTAAPERLFRSAIKPPKAVGQKVEVASKNTLSDVFHANPEADKIAATPFEGYDLTLKQVKRDVGKEMDAGLRQAGFSGRAGDEIATEINKSADRLEKAARPAADVEYLRQRARDHQGKLTDMESLRDGVTFANQARTPLFMMANEKANPKFAQVDNIVNEIIARVGGNFENKALESLKGPDGLVLRKKWSDLSTLEREASGRLNKLLNDAPPKARSAIVEALSTPAGAGAAIGLSFGKLGAIVPLISSISKAYARKLTRELKDSNALITRAYDKLRANPPPRPSRTPPILPEYLPPVIPTAPTVGGVAVPPPNLERLIEQRIREMGGTRIMGSNQPALARRIAVQELSEEGLIPPQ